MCFNNLSRCIQLYFVVFLTGRKEEDMEIREEILFEKLKNFISEYGISDTDDETCLRLSIMIRNEKYKGVEYFFQRTDISDIVDRYRSLFTEEETELLSGMYEILRKQQKEEAKEGRYIPVKRYISDCHFYHDSLNRQMDCRGFENYHVMNERMIEQWNSTVQDNDEVYILGDLSIAKGKKTNEIVSQLKGRLYMIAGNHDAFLKDKEFDASRFRWVKDYAEIMDRQRKVILSHYPVFCYNGQFRRDEEGSASAYMLYGHVHDTFDEVLVNSFVQITRKSLRTSKYNVEPECTPCHMINCFCKYSDYVPLTLDEWIVLDEKRREELTARTGEIPFYLSTDIMK